MTREEQIRKAAEIIAYGCSDELQKALINDFPELAESEDERIRKELLNHCYRCSKQITTVVNIEDYNRWIAWLEKQKEPHYIKRNALFDKCVENCDPEVMKSVSDKIDEILEKEQKPAEWSKEDEAKKERLISIVKRALHGNEYPILNDNGATELITWLKSLRPQPLRKDTYYDIIHNILATLKDMDFIKITPEHRGSLLNDIRVKCKNADECAAILDEPHWKPSEKQMSMLLSILNEPNNASSESARLMLESLYNDLKAL